jgi:hypothetical protein
MSIKSAAHLAAEQAPPVAPPKFVLILSPAPRSAIRKYLTLPPDATRAYTVEKYSTRFGSTFEKHIMPSGVATWWKLTAPGFVYDWKSATWVKV